MQTLHPRSYYRLPWSLNDNVLSWLEPTKRCNLYCEGCYSRNDPASDKSLEQIRSDLDVFTAHRRFDSVSITGGDPLVHEQIVEIVRIIRREYGLKPVLNTNALALTPELVRALKKAGLFGFTFHIDSSQHRPGWTGKSEVELNELRLHYAQMVAEVGGMSVAFNATVFPHTLEEFPDLLDWAREHIDLVHSMVFILFRTTRAAEFDFFAQGRQIDPGELVYQDERRLPRPLTAPDLVAALRQREPGFEPCAYLGGTKDPSSFKWLIAGRIGDARGIHGYVGPRFMELTQTGHHALTGRYLAYSSPRMLGMGRTLLLAGALFDGGLRRAAMRWAGAVARRPWRVAARAHFQSVAIIQPIDFMPDGEANMCDGCPDMTVHDNELVWSCRLDERLRYGCFLTAAPRKVTSERSSQSRSSQSQPSQLPSSHQSHQSHQSRSSSSQQGSGS
ncbi:MAG: radical SAM protein [Deltaproteobacteria bacterium]|nr:radical SAM protein [Deltaproteobacteria bacterium]